MMKVQAIVQKYPTTVRVRIPYIILIIGIVYGIMLYHTQDAAAQISPPTAAITPVILDEGPVTAALWYKFYWSGLYIGDVVFGAEEAEDGAYTLRFSVESGGLVRMITNFYGRAHSRGTRKDGEYQPEILRNRFNVKNEIRNMALYYDADGTITDRMYDPPIKRWKRPDVPPELRDNVPDPLSAGMIIHKRIAQALRNGDTTFTQRIYDGHRLADFHFEVLGNTVLDMKKRRYTGYKVRFSRTPIAGYKTSELEEAGTHDAKVDVIFTDDGRLIPIRITGTALMGTAVGHLNKVCHTFEACEQAAREAR